MCKGDKKEKKDDEQGADPFFWVTLFAFAPAAAAAVFAPNKAPGYALEATGVYRLELGLIFFAATYVLGLVLILAYQGRSIGQLNLANVVETDLPDPKEEPDPDLTVAKTGFDKFESQANERLKAAEDSFVEVGRRLAALEEAEERRTNAGHQSFANRVRRVISRP